MKKQNLELKHYCNDFSEVRKKLKQIGAEKDIVKHQKDFFFSLPKEKSELGARLKLRVEGDERALVYYERPEFTEDKETDSDILLLETNEKMLDFLRHSLGVLGIVEKDREVWKKDKTVFHLDTVEGVGKVFEIELQREEGIQEKDRELFRKYQEQLTPLLGDVVEGSNIDLVLE